ncbi:MAG: LPS export ABC transporter periplasmic protein LptC [Rubrivivax sp.]
MSPKAPRSIELTLPDLPEVPITLGPAAGGSRPEVAPQPWPLRLREALSSALPLLLMVVLAVGSWWLVRNAPQPLEPRPPASTRMEPDYTMTGFMVQRFGADGRLRVQIEGRQLRHLPVAGRLEIEGATIRAFGPDGRETVAIARQALADDKATEVQLIGGARVQARSRQGEDAVLEGERLLLYPKDRRVRSDEAVRVRLGADEFQATGLDYREDTGVLELLGPMRGVFAPRPSPTPGTSLKP